MTRLLKIATLRMIHMIQYSTSLFCPLSRTLLSFLPALSFLCMLTTACAPSRVPALYTSPVQDIVSIEQRPAAFVRPETAQASLFPDIRTTQRGQDFLRHWLAPWQRSVPAYTARQALWGLDLLSRPIYGENLLPRTPAWRQQLRLLTDKAGYPNTNAHAITLVTTALRALPTKKPIFYSPLEAGEGFPFDYLQNSIIAAQTPVFVSHVSADGAWALVECWYAGGWVSVRDIAWADNSFQQSFVTGITQAMLTATDDKTPVHDAGKTYRFSSRIGMLLPYMPEKDKTEPDKYTVSIAAADTHGQAILLKTTVPATAFQPFPLPDTAQTLARLAGELTGQPYGWGGLYENRDCSSSLLDIFAATGIALPRNSAAQARRGRVYSLKDQSPKRKEQFIIKTAIPWRTLLFKPGHIMLYIGHQQQKALVLHTVWGLPTQKYSRQGRHIIGKTAITTLTPGHELSTIPRHKLLLHTITGMTLIQP